MKIRIHKHYFAFIVIVWAQLAPYYIAQSLEENRFVDLFFTALSFSLAVYFVIGDLNKMRPLLFLFSLPFALLVISTAQNGGNLYQTVTLFLRVVLYCLLVDVLSKDKLEISIFLHAVRDISLLYFVVNIVVIIIFPQGLAESSGSIAYYLYGNPNTMIRYVMPGLCCSSLLDVRKGKKMSGITFFFFAGLFFIYTTTYFSVTSFMGTLFISIWIALKDSIKPRMGITRLTYYSVLLIVLLFEINVVISVSGADFAILLNNFFGKTDMGGIVSRRVLWTRGISLFIQKPVMGWGQLDTATLSRLIGNSSGVHNYFLDIAYQRGIIGLGTFLIIFIYSVYRISKIKSISDMGYILMGYCCMCFLMFLAEPFTSSEPIIMPIFYAFISVDLGRRNSLNYKEEFFIRHNGRKTERLGALHK